ncbi:MAG TPA: hypothetical protein VGG46_13340 [Terriglobales bacterium]|jgi:hypothetical protein
MKRFLNLIAFSFIAINLLASDDTVTNDSPASQKERLYQRFVKEMQQLDPSNLDMSFTNGKGQAALRMVFESVIVDPSFGLEWDEVPAPTLLDSNALSAVNSFIATNGWNMQTNDCIFDCISDDDNEAKSRPIGGLPWAVIHEQEFPAVTHDNILYVFFRGFHHDGHGVAYNPSTNHFAATIDSFKPIGQHWYVWEFDHEFPQSVPQPQIYEGAKPIRDATPASK